MLRRILSVALLLCLLTGLTPARAEDAPETAVFLLVDRTPEGDVPLGSAVLFVDDTTLLTTVWALMAKTEMLAIGPGGEYAVLGAMSPSEESELALLNLDRACTQAEPAQLYSTGGSEAMRRVIGYTASGMRCEAAVKGAQTVHYAGADAALLTVPAKLLPGGVLVDEEGMFAGLVAAAWGEGENRYAALSREALGQDFVAGGMAALSDVWTPEPMSVDYQDGCLLLRWPGYDYPEREDEVCTVYYADVKNTYYSGFSVKDGAMELELPVLPGRTYSIWLDVKTPEGEELLSKPRRLAVEYTVPEATFADYGFRSVSVELACLDKAQTPETTDVLTAMESLTAQTLDQPQMKYYLQVHDTYEVTGEISMDMVIALRTPEDYAFSMISGYVFAPEYGQSDRWNADVTQLLDGYLEYNGTGMFAPGAYTLSYWFNGRKAGEMTFTLE